MNNCSHIIESRSDGYAQPIDVITYHDEDGSFKPYRFRMKDDDGELLTIQVRRIVDKKEEKITGTYYNTYYCLCTVYDMSKTFELRFIRDTGRWFLMNII